MPHEFFFILNIFYPKRNQMKNLNAISMTNKILNISI